MRDDTALRSMLVFAEHRVAIGHMLVKKGRANP
jgi:hypothetical protein